MQTRFLEKDLEQVGKCVKSAGIACATLHGLVKAEDPLLSIMATELLEQARYVEGTLKRLASTIGLEIPEAHQDRKQNEQPQAYAGGSAEAGSNTRPYQRRAYGSR